MQDGESSWVFNHLELIHRINLINNDNAFQNRLFLGETILPRSPATIYSSFPGRDSNGVKEKVSLHGNMV